MENWSDKDIRTPVNHCPYCGYQLDAASEVDALVADHTSAQPVQGDISVCMSCAQVMVFNADLTVRRPTTAEFADIRTSPSYDDVLKAQRAVRSLDRRDLKGAKP